ncbi:hypothetical protein [Natrarchaeobaculum sulfurireducens]|uniref:Acetyl-CoA acetyltransferase n=1 Tax=Natrarchaeobaculum sulfurireducens TaxID=2044521 RepID=A0A346PD18_9EURY|nr:hypothetical protein [Natrarchaeobaculum sulfurireducens]AXR77413.1 Acetyl-CoA acetyltransferase [Natrarchaeobaculum sulfurireducens]
MTVQIAGVASTPYGNHPDSSTRELFTDAALEALEDASISVDDIEELYAGNFIGDFPRNRARRRSAARR